MHVCPFGAIVLDRSAGSTFVCDLCDGDPLRVRLCPLDTLKYITGNEFGIRLKRIRADKLLEFLKSSSVASEWRAFRRHLMAYLYGGDTLMVDLSRGKTPWGRSALQNRKYSPSDT